MPFAIGWAGILTCMECSVCDLCEMHAGQAPGGLDWQLGLNLKAPLQCACCPTSQT